MQASLLFGGTNSFDVLVHSQGIGSAQRISTTIEVEILFKLYPCVFQQVQGRKGSVHNLACYLHICKAGMGTVGGDAITFQIGADENGIGGGSTNQVFGELSGRPLIIGENSVVTAEEDLGRLVVPILPYRNNYNFG